MPGALLLVLSLVRRGRSREDERFQKEEEPPPHKTKPAESLHGLVDGTAIILLASLDDDM